MYYLKLLAISFCLISVNLPMTGWSVGAALEEPATATMSWEDVTQFAKENLPLEGQLVMKSDGFGYIKVDDAYIHDLLPMLDLTYYKEPPYFRSEDSPGAHISVFYVDEHVMPEEVGQTFPFTLKEIVIVRPSKTTSYVVLQVESPELENLREKYGLSRKLHGHEFHISIGKKVTHIPKPLASPF